MRPEDFPLAMSYERSKKGLTQKQLAELLNVSDRSIKLWEAGTSMPRKALRIRMAQEFGLSPIFFLQDSELPQNVPEDLSPTPDPGEIHALFERLTSTLNDIGVSEDLKKTLTTAIRSTLYNATMDK